MYWLHRSLGWMGLVLGLGLAGCLNLAGTAKEFFPRYRLFSPSLHPFMHPSFHLYSQPGKQEGLSLSGCLANKSPLHSFGLFSTLIYQSDGYREPR